MAAFCFPPRRSSFLEIALFLVRLDHVASRIGFVLIINTSTADRTAAHRKSGQSRVYLGAVGLRKGALLWWKIRAGRVGD